MVVGALDISNQKNFRCTLQVEIKYEENISLRVQ